MRSLLTPYGEKLNRALPLPDYPRPQMIRDSYLCLNGIWQYSITKTQTPPEGWAGEILVPFPPESALSGVAHVLQPGETLWYRRVFELPADFRRERVLLHFGGVDECCDVLVNGRTVGQHDGGYFPFSLDITDALRAGQNELVVMAIDETETAPYARGSQRLHPEGRTHTPMSGIWQTVWMESVPAQFVRELAVCPLYDEGQVRVTVTLQNPQPDALVEIFAGSTLTASGRCASGQPLELRMSGAISWHPGNPFLYAVRVTTGEDQVVGYFGMRKFSVEPDAGGLPRLMLNNKPFFACGVIDQGFYSDSLYTPPSDEAMERDIRFAKDCGFNVIRKTGKIEPLRWYYHCDRLGLLVWQDLPGGGPGGLLGQSLIKLPGNNDRTMFRLSSEGREWRKTYGRDMERVAKLLGNCAGVQAYVLFDEGYGQFDALAAAERMSQLDPTRLVDHASGHYDQGGGDIRSLHFYGEPTSLLAPGGERAVVFTSVGDFGGCRPEHFCGETPEAARMLKKGTELSGALEKLYQKSLAPLVACGLSGVFLRQLTDAQDEVSGLQSCDRRLQKLRAATMAALNEGLAAQLKSSFK